MKRTVRLSLCLALCLIACKSPLPAPPSTGRTTDPPVRPEARGSFSTITKSQYDSTYSYTHSSPEYSSWANKSYDKWSVAFKDANNPDNVYYDRKHIDVRNVRSTQDFVALNDGRSRNRFISDAQYDDVAYASDTTEYCLRATLSKVDYFRSEGETGGHEWYIKHWTFTAPRGPVGAKGVVHKLGDFPWEDNVFHSENTPGPVGTKTS